MANVRDQPGYTVPLLLRCSQRHLYPAGSVVDNEEQEEAKRPLPSRLFRLIFTDVQVTIIKVMIAPFA